ncbi:FxSxx-COOH system tetratricopeptide repeat protein [Nocardia sp. NPDC004340]
MSVVRRPATLRPSTSIGKATAGGDLNITYNQSGGQPVQASSSPLAGLRVGASGLIPQKPAHFVERDQVEALETGLGGDRIAVVVTGMRGAGKTHLAAAYARRVLARREGLVGWINAEAPETLYTGLAGLADRLEVAAPDGDTVESARLLRDYLSSSEDRHLLVLDNAEDVELLRAVIPVDGGTRVVITTTNQAMAGLTTVVVDAGTGYTPDQAHTYLREATGITDDPTGEEALACELGYLPLALAAAAASIAPPNAPRLNYHAYLQRLRDQPLPLALKRREGHEYPFSVDQALLLAIRSAQTPTGIRELDSTVAWLLGLFALLSPAGINRNLLVHPDPLLNQFVDAAISHCTRRSLLTWSATTEALLAHRLTARVLLEEARDHHGTTELIRNALDMLEPHLFDGSQGWLRRAEGAHLVDQIEAIHAYGVPDLTAKEATRRWFARRQRPTSLAERSLLSLKWATSQLIFAADPQRAIPLAHVLLRSAEKVFGAHGVVTAICRDELALAYRDRGQVERAIPLLERTLIDTERAQGADHRDSWTSRGNLAGALERVGRVDEAILLFERVLADRERVQGIDHPDTLTTRCDLASALQKARRLEEAILLFECVLADREHILGDTHANTLTTRNNLAVAYREAGRPEDAILLLERALVDRERLLGVDHPDSLACRNNLAVSYGDAGREEEAMQLLERTVADRARVLGVDHPDTLISRNNLAGAVQRAGRIDEAVLLFERTLADSERVQGADHPVTLAVRGNLVIALQTAKRAEESIPLSERTLADRERVLGVDHPHTLASRNCLAKGYLEAGRTEEAISQFERNLAEHERLLGVDDPDTRALRSYLARLRADLEC